MTLPSALDAARERRAQGFYDCATLKLFHGAWRERQDSESLIAWLAFRRDLGYPLHHRHYSRLRDAVGGRGWAWRPGGITPVEAKRGKMLCREYEFQKETPPPDTRGVASPRWKLWESEVRWRAEFLQWLSGRGERGVALVGNGVHRHGSELGREVDGHGTVLRFNQYSAVETKPVLGSRLDVWVRAPNFRGPEPEVEWVILTGPAAQFTLWNLGSVMRQVRRGTKLVCVPLDIWQSLVRRLESPPSSGILMAFWLSRLPMVRPHLQIYGFGYDPEGEEGYHQALPQHPPSSRHNWSRERTLLVELTGGAREA